MTGPNTGSAMSIEDFAGSVFDHDFTERDSGGTVETPPETPGADAAGTPPAVPAGSTDEDQNGQGESATETPVVGAPDATVDADTPPDDDPFKDATPFTYTVNGQAKTFDELRILPGHGAVIAPDAFPKLAQRLAERDNLYERSQTQYQQYQALEKLTAWNVTGADGKAETLTGAAALIARATDHAETKAALDTILDAFKNPARFAELVDATVDAAGNVIFSPHKGALENLMTRSDLAESRAREQIQKLYATVQQTAPQERDQPIDVAAHAETIVSGLVSQAGMTGLTPADTKYLAMVLPRYVRPVTKEDIAANPALAGERLVVDDSFSAIMQDRQELRSTTAKTVESVASVTKENAARLAAAARGAPAKIAPVVRKVVNPDTERAEASHSLFDMMERGVAGR